MKERIKKVWVKALTGKKYKQGRTRLRTRNGFCCLGVLCDLYGKETGVEWKKTSDGWVFLEKDCTLPRAVMKWAGLKSPNPNPNKPNEWSSLTNRTLAGLNDGGKKFKAIAKVIKEAL